MRQGWERPRHPSSQQLVQHLGNAVSWYLGDSETPEPEVMKGLGPSTTWVQPQPTECGPLAWGRQPGPRPHSVGAHVPCCCGTSPPAGPQCCKQTWRAIIQGGPAEIRSLPLLCPLPHTPCCHVGREEAEKGRRNRNLRA